MLKIQLCITGINYMLSYLKKKTAVYILIIFHVLLYFDQINATLVSIRDLFQKQQQNRSKANFQTFCIVKMRCIQDVKVYRFTENGRNAHKTTCKAPQVSTKLEKTPFIKVDKCIRLA